MEKEIPILKVVRNKHFADQIYVFNCEEDISLSSPLTFGKGKEEGEVLMRSNINTDIYRINNSEYYLNMYYKALELLGDKNEWIKKN